MLQPVRSPWSNQRSAAIQQYRECVRVLDQELGVPPLDETMQLYQAIKENRAAPPPVQIADLGAGGPLREFQVGVDASTRAWVARDGRLWLLTDRDSPRWRLATTRYWPSLPVRPSTVNGLPTVSLAGMAGFAVTFCP